MKFIKLIEVHGNNSTKPIYINFDHVQSFSVGMKGKDTHIRMYDKSFFFVKETIEEIDELICVDRTRAPILMSADEYQRVFNTGLG